LETAWRANPEGRPDQQPKIEAARMDQQPLEDIVVTAQMRAAHPARLIEMREGAFDILPASTHQAASPSATNPPTIAIHRCLGFRLIRPVASTPVGLGDVGPEARRVEVDHGLITVIALVADDLFEWLWLLDLRLCGVYLLSGSFRGLGDRRRVA
jgi:hypothetical protein